MPHNGYRAFNITHSLRGFLRFCFTRLKRGMMKTLEEAHSRRPGVPA
jgi:hypothetical protein